MCLNEKMNVNTTNEGLLRRYLLGTCTEAECESLEAQFLDDDMLFDEITSLEGELYMEYAAGELIGQEKSLFEQKFLRTAEDKRRAGFADALVSTIGDIAATRPSITEASPAQAERRSFFDSIGSFLGLSSTAMSFGATAAMLLLALGVGFFLFQRANLRPDDVATVDGDAAVERQEQERAIAEKEERRTELERQLTAPDASEPDKRDAEAERDKLTNEIEERRRKIDRLPPVRRRDETEPTGRSVIALALSPGRSVRSDDGPDQTRIELTAGIKQVAMTLALKNVDQYPHYQASVRTVDDDREVFSSAKVRARLGRGGKRISITIPAARLGQADYEILLTGVKTDGGTEELTRYYFSAVRVGR